MPAVMSARWLGVDRGPLMMLILAATVASHLLFIVIPKASSRSRIPAICAANHPRRPETCSSR